MAAQKGILAVSEVSPIPQVSTVLMKQTGSKSIPQAEFACRSLEILVKTAPPQLYFEPQFEDQCLQIVHCLCEILEQK